MLLADPSSIIVDTAPEPMQLERVKLQNNEILKSKHRRSDLLEFYGALVISSYPMLGMQAMRLMSLFGITHICEQSFRVMNHN